MVRGFLVPGQNCDVADAFQFCEDDGHGLLFPTVAKTQTTERATQMKAWNNFGDTNVLFRNPDDLSVWPKLSA